MKENLAIIAHFSSAGFFLCNEKATRATWPCELLVMKGLAEPVWPSELGPKRLFRFSGKELIDQSAEADRWRHERERYAHHLPRSQALPERDGDGSHEAHQRAEKPEAQNSRALVLCKQPLFDLLHGSPPFRDG